LTVNLHLARVWKSHSGFGPILICWWTMGFRSLERSVGIYQVFGVPFLSLDIFVNLGHWFQQLQRAWNQIAKKVTIIITKPSPFHGLIKHTRLKGSPWSRFSSSHLQSTLGQRCSLEGSTEHLLHSSSVTKHPVTNVKSCTKGMKSHNHESTAQKKERKSMLLPVS